MWIPLEANLELGSLQSKAAPITSLVFGTNTRKSYTLLFVVEPDLMVQEVLRWVLDEIIFVFRYLRHVLSSPKPFRSAGDGKIGTVEEGVIGDESSGGLTSVYGRLV